MITSQILADSINTAGERITTFKVTFPRIILAEINTHRAFSRNSASSRAIPFKRMVKMVQENPFIPIRWMKDHKGMQGNEYFEGLTCKDAWLGIDRCFGYSQYEGKPATEYLTEKWLQARDEAVQTAEMLAELGLSKQIVNRLLEPFMWHTAIITATDYGNFFALRAHEAAEIHLQDLAYKMLDEYNKSEPVKLQDGEWHIPYGDQFDNDKLDELMGDGLQPASMGWARNELNKLKVKIATARCARLSYQTLGDNPVIDYKKDIELHDNLMQAGHFSPFEHCAYAKPGTRSGNFNGFVQYRHTLSNENRWDDRIIDRFKTQ